MPEDTSIYINMPKFAGMAYVSHVPVVTPCLLERVVTYLNEVYSLKEHERRQFCFLEKISRD